ncbi:3-hydroxyacyl-CoA dehydrogenase family protein [Actinomadura namibiensis]|uniref:3-hydroxyacyl-CoA dehydrogenase family protein n=1 Tax=Actinomadura kijaniata TaxID=46161 RepID=UPI0036173CD5
MGAVPVERAARLPESVTVVDALAEFDEHCPPGTVIATNTSALPVDHLAAALTRHPERFLGAHFFFPAPREPLCEMQRGSATAAWALRGARDVIESWGMRCLVIDGTVAGSVASLFGVLVAEAMRLRGAGAATAEDIDLLCEQGLGQAMGPLRSMELIGRDTVLRAMRHGGLRP